jgi:hypothetical protein
MISCEGVTELTCHSVPVLIDAYVDLVLSAACATVHSKKEMNHNINDSVSTMADEMIAKTLWRAEQKLDVDTAYSGRHLLAHKMTSSAEKHCQKHK